MSEEDRGYPAEFDEEEDDIDRGESTDGSSDEDIYPKGRHEVTCTGHIDGGNDKNGLPMLAIQVRFANDAIGACTLSFSGGAKEISKTKLKACGWRGGKDIGSEIADNKVFVNVSYRSYVDKKGKKRRGVDIDIDDGGGAFRFNKPMTDSEKSDFFATLAGSTGGSSPNQAATQKPGSKSGFSINKEKGAG